MTPEERAQLKMALMDIKESKYVSTEAKILAVRDVIRSILPPESYIVKAASEDLAPPSTSSDTPLERQKEMGNQRLQDLLDATLAFLPVAKVAGEQGLASTAPNLSNMIETEVRLALNERFMSSWIFRGVIILLAVGLTLFSFGLFQLNS